MTEGEKCCDTEDYKKTTTKEIVAFGNKQKYYNRE